MKFVLTVFCFVVQIFGVNAATIFTESFENPTVTGSTSDDPTGWAGVGHPGYQGLVNVDSLTFTTPYGDQALKGYTTTTAWSGAKTTDSILSDVLTTGTTYTLTFNVAALSTRTKAAYRAALLVDDGAGTVTELAFTSGIGDGSHNMSFGDSIVFTPGAGQAALIGKRLVVMLGMNPDYGSDGAAYQDQPLFDNVLLDATTIPEPSAALLGSLGFFVILRRRR